MIVLQTWTQQRRSDHVMPLFIYRSTTDDRQNLCRIYSDWMYAISAVANKHPTYIASLGFSFLSLRTESLSWQAAYPNLPFWNSILKIHILCNIVFLKIIERCVCILCKIWVNKCISPETSSKAHIFRSRYVLSLIAHINFCHVRNKKTFLPPFPSFHRLPSTPLLPSTPNPPIMDQTLCQYINNRKYLV